MATVSPISPWEELAEIVGHLRVAWEEADKDTSPKELRDVCVELVGRQGVPAENTIKNIFLRAGDDPKKTQNPGYATLRLVWRAINILRIGADLDPVPFDPSETLGRPLTTLRRQSEHKTTCSVVDLMTWRNTRREFRALASSRG